MAGLFRDMKLEGYISELSAKTIVPGGGSVSALAASLGAGLNLMVINFSYGKKNSVDTKELLDSLKGAQPGIQHELVLLIDEDCAVFKELMRAISQGKHAEKEYMEAARVPFKICERALSSIRITRELLRSANKNLICDIGCAANILKAAFDSAELNVRINLKGLPGSGSASAMAADLVRMRKEAHTLCDGIMSDTKNIF